MDKHNEYSRAFWHHSIVRNLFGNEHRNHTILRLRIVLANVNLGIHNFQSYFVCKTNFGQLNDPQGNTMLQEWHMLYNKLLNLEIVMP